MIRYLVVLSLFATWLFGALKITTIHQLENGIAVNFNTTIAVKDFKTFSLKSNGVVRYVYDIEAELLGGARVFNFQDSIMIKIAQNSKDKVRVVITLPRETKIALSVNEKQANLRIENAKTQKDSISIAALFESSTSKQKKQQDKATKTNASNKVTNVGKSKVVVIDPGHGGKDCGAIGTEKVCEKYIALKISKYLHDELKKRGYKVFMTREKDTFIGLRERTKFANQKSADLFISIHANAVKENKEKLEGVESYFLSTARGERAKKVAALENKDDTGVMNHFSKQSFLDTLNTQRIVASNKLAIDVQYGMLQSLRKNYKVVDGGVREGPFWVLVGALMPSVLLEVGYVTHPQEGKFLNQNAYQKSLALGIANGIDAYFKKNP